MKFHIPGGMLSKPSKCGEGNQKKRKEIKRRGRKSKEGEGKKGKGKERKKGKGGYLTSHS